MLEDVDTTDTPIRRKRHIDKKRAMKCYNCYRRVYGVVHEGTKKKVLNGRRGFHKWLHRGSQCLSWVQMINSK